MSCLISSTCIITSRSLFGGGIALPKVLRECSVYAPALMRPNKKARSQELYDVLMCRFVCGSDMLGANETCDRDGVYRAHEGKTHFEENPLPWHYFILTTKWRPSVIA